MEDKKEAKLKVFPSLVLSSKIADMDLGKG